MNLPAFFVPSLPGPSSSAGLEGESFRHAVQVLRMKAGDKLQLTDGHGRLALAVIQEVTKKDCTLHIDEVSGISLAPPEITIGISLLKNASRLEWFLEKAAELGIRRVAPLVCQRTERQQFRKDRLQGILVSAMLQSQQVWLTELNDPVSFSEFISQNPALPGTECYIAHCMEGEKKELQGELSAEKKPAVMLIGPEGDFNADEIRLATGAGYLPTSLGASRLRTETAGVAAAVLLRLRRQDQCAISS